MIDQRNGVNSVACPNFAQIVEEKSHLHSFELAPSDFDNRVTAPHRLSGNLRSSFVRCGLLQKRKRNRELCALSFTRTFRVYLALMTLDDLSRDRQT